MTISNQVFHFGIPFEEYLQLPGTSYSDIKNEGCEKFVPTAKMRLGTDVHNYLLTPAEYKHDNIAIVKPLALELKKQIPDVILKRCLPELAVTATFSHEGLSLNYRGRLDLGLPGRIVIDFKITENLNVAFFGYDRQLSGYALGIGAKVALIIAIHPKTKKTSIINIPVSASWWEQEVKKRGNI